MVPWELPDLSCIGCSGTDPTPGSLSFRNELIGTPRTSQDNGSGSGMTVIFVRTTKTLDWKSNDCSPGCDTASRPDVDPVACEAYLIGLHHPEKET